MGDMDEVWLPIKDFEGCYEISNKGRVKSLERDILSGGRLRHKKERILKPYSSKNRNNRYEFVVLCKDGKTYPALVHRLVAIAFLPNPDNNPIVDHIDTNPTNNNAENLRWTTVQGNCMNPLTRIHNSESKKGHRGYLTHHSEETKRKLREINTGRKLTEEQRKKISESHKGLRKGTTSDLKGKHWKVEGGKRVWY